MTVTLTNEPGPGAVHLEPSDPLAPPPKAGNDRWNLAVTVLLALLLNITLFGVLFIRLPVKQMTRPDEPPAISVELVRQPKPQPKPQQQPKPQEQPKPEQPKPEPKAEDKKNFYRESGSGNPNLKMGKVQKTDDARTKTPPKPQAKEKKNEPPKVATPDWANKVASGFDLPRTRDKTTSSQPSKSDASKFDSLLLGEGGGDPYLKAMQDQIYANLVYPLSEQGRVGTPVFGIVVSHPGTIKGLRLLRSSGYPDIDFAAQQAILKSAPFRPLPNDYPNVVSILAPITVSPNPR